jgi:hypothetical protein
MHISRLTTAAAAVVAVLLVMPAGALASQSVTITKKPPSMSGSTRATIAWRATGRTVCSLDSHPAERCTSPLSLGRLRDGAHVLTVRLAGTHVSAAARWTVDTTAPTAPAVSGGSAAWLTTQGASVAIRAHSTDAGSGVAYYERREGFPQGGGGGTPVRASSFTATDEGSYIVQFRAVDRLGHASAWAPAKPNGKNMARLDWTAPVLSALEGDNDGAWHSLSASLSASAVDNVSQPHYWWAVTIDGATGPWHDGAVATIEDEGASEVCFVAVDAAGNASAHLCDSVQVDSTAPPAPELRLADGVSCDAIGAGTTLTAVGDDDLLSGRSHFVFELSFDGGDTFYFWEEGALQYFDGADFGDVQMIDENGDGQPDVDFTADTLTLNVNATPMAFVWDVDNAGNWSDMGQIACP